MNVTVLFGVDGIGLKWMKMGYRTEEIIFVIIFLLQIAAPKTHQNMREFPQNVTQPLSKRYKPINYFQKHGRFLRCVRNTFFK